MSKLALITGITGQDGSYLAELLLDKGYIVHGIVRRSSDFNTRRIENIIDKIHLSYGDGSDTINILSIIKKIQSENKHFDRLEVYNLAAMSHVKVSFEMPEFTSVASGTSVLHVLEAIRHSGIPLDKVRFYQASTSELYGKVQEVPQKETTPFYPRSPYGVAKMYGYWITINYRESYGMFACNGILFNHESPRRGPTFVTRKVTIGLANILKGKQDCLVMGNLDSKRDWGHAKDYVEGMWRILQSDEADDYVLSTNEYHSVREFIEIAFKYKNIDIKWRGTGLDEEGYDAKTGKVLIKVSEKYFRPAEVEELLGDSTKARTKLEWKPQHSFESLVKDMVDSDCS